MKSRRAWWLTGIGIVLMLVGLVTYFAMIVSYYDGVAPKGRDFRGLVDEVEITSVTKCELQGSVYYLCTGARTPGYVMASASPVYVFDGKGHLQEWIRDSGDQPKAMARWNSGNRQNIAVKQALREIYGVP